MAEYKNGFNAFGGMPVDSSRRSPELHTGRAVYINDDEYSDEPNYKDKADSIVREGYHKEAPFEAPEIIVPEPIIPSGTKNITENGTYDVAQFAKAEVNVADGSSDFSTAEVTVVNSTENLGIDLVLSVCVEENAMGQGSPACMSPRNDVSVGTYNVSVPMYKGTALGMIMTSNVNVSTEGAVTFNNGRLIITGDCTITIS